ncbi:MAG: hypothetical protein ACE5E9_08330 [Nitrospinaceae bacterium]
MENAPIKNLEKAINQLTKAIHNLTVAIHNPSVSGSKLRTIQNGPVPILDAAPPPNSVCPETHCSVLNGYEITCKHTFSRYKTEYDWG